MAKTEEEEKSDEQGNIIQRLLGGLVPNFSGGFGGIFSWLFSTGIFVGICYLLLRIPQVQKLVGSIIPTEYQAFLNDKLGDGFFPDAAKDMLNPEIMDEERLGKVLVEHADVAEANARPLAKLLQENRTVLYDIVTRAPGNDGKFNLKTIRSQATQDLLLKEQPQLAIQLAALMPKPGETAAAATGPDGKPLPNQPAAAAAPTAAEKQALEGVHRTVSDPNQLNSMLAKDKFDTTMGTLAAMMSISGVAVDKAALGKFVRAVGMNGDTPTPAFAQFLKQSTDPNGTAATRAKAMQDFMLPLIGKASTATAVQELLLSIKPEAITGNPGLSEFRALAGNAKNFAALSVLVNHMEAASPGKLGQFLSIVGSDPAKAMKMVDQDPQLAAELTTFKGSADMDKLPTNFKSMIVNATDPEMRRSIQNLAANGVDVNKASEDPNAILKQVATNAAVTPEVIRLAEKNPEKLNINGFDMASFVRASKNNPGLIRHVFGSLQQLGEHQIDLSAHMGAMMDGGKFSLDKALNYFTNKGEPNAAPLGKRQSGYDPVNDFGMVLYAYTKTPAFGKMPANQQNLVKFLVYNADPGNPFPNLHALQKFGQYVAAHGGNTDMVKGLMGLITDNKEMMKALDTDKFLAFVKDDANYNALSAMVQHGLDARGFPAGSSQGRILQALWQDWDEIGAVLRANDDGGKTLLDGMRSGKPPGERRSETDIGIASWWSWTGLVDSVPKSIAQHSTAVVHLRDAISPPPTPKGAKADPSMMLN